MAQLVLAGVGLFTVVLCGFLASVYLIGEADNENDKQRFIQKAKRTNIIAVVAGVLVFAAAIADEIPLLNWVFGRAGRIDRCNRSNAILDRNVEMDQYNDKVSSAHTGWVPGDDDPSGDQLCAFSKFCNS